VFSWLEKLDQKRWWNMFVIVGFVFAVLFGTGAVTVVDAEAGFIISIATLCFGIAEAANHKKVTNYRKGKVSHFDPYLQEEYFADEIKNSPTMLIPDGETYVREPVFLGIVLEAVSAILFITGVIKLFLA